MEHISFLRIHTTHARHDIPSSFYPRKGGGFHLDHGPSHSTRLALIDGTAVWLPTGHPIPASVIAAKLLWGKDYIRWH